jgi:predicted alpha/beta hydrolase family esterase
MAISSEKSRVLIVPGLGNSGPAHWQSLWEAHDGYHRVQQRVREAAADVLIAAHSLGTLLVTHWLAGTKVRIGGASIDDPYGDLAFAHQCAKSWGSRLVNIGEAGHIYAASGLGEWNGGHRLLESLRTQIE